MNVKDLSKEDLLLVIADMQDCIVNWSNGYGLSEKDAEKLNEVGDTCLQYCCRKYNYQWDLDDIGKAK